MIWSFKSQTLFIYPTLVKDLWMPNQQVWNEKLIDSLFQQPTAHIIKQTPISLSHDQDILCCKLTPNDKCNSKSAYYVCLQRLQEMGEPLPRQVSPATTQLLKHVWKNKAIMPRIKSFAWCFL
jgi:hypothetical protein